MGTGSSFLPRLFCRALLVVGLVCLLVVGSISTGRGTRKPTTLSSPTWPAERYEHGHVIGSDHKPVNVAELDFNYMSKRRVPNGPDPIHNRKAGNSGRPPGQAQSTGNSTSFSNLAEDDNLVLVRNGTD